MILRCAEIRSIPESREPRTLPGKENPGEIAWFDPNISGFFANIFLIEFGGR